MWGNNAFPRRTFYFPPWGTAPDYGSAAALPRPPPLPPGPYPKAAGRAQPRNATEAAVQTATPLPQPAKIYSTGPGATRKAARGHQPHSFQPRRREVGEKASRLAPGFWVPWVWADDPRPSPSAPSRSGRPQSSRPRPPPPATPESWQRRRQRRKGEPRRPPPCELCNQPNEQCLKPRHLLRNKPATGSFLEVAPFPSGLFRLNTDGRMRSGKGCGGLFLWGTRAVASQH